MFKIVVFIVAIASLPSFSFADLGTTETPSLTAREQALMLIATKSEELAATRIALRDAEDKVRGTKEALRTAKRRGIFFLVVTAGTVFATLKLRNAKVPSSGGDLAAGMNAISEIALRIAQIAAPTFAVVSGGIAFVNVRKWKHLNDELDGLLVSIADANKMIDQKEAELKELKNKL